MGWEHHPIFPASIACAARQASAPAVPRSVVVSVVRMHAYPTAALAVSSLLLVSGSALAQQRPTLTGPELTHPSADGHLLIHYTLGGADALPDTEDLQPANGIPDAVDDVEEGMRLVWQTFVDQQGWPAPPADQGVGGDDRLDVYLRVIDANGYAHYVAVPGGHTTWMEVDHDARNLGSLTLQSIAGHELHHALQATLVTGAGSWIYEATATWTQYRLFTGTVVLDLARQVLWGTRLGEPHRPLNDTGNRYEYAGMVWVQFLLDHGTAPYQDLLGLWQDMASTGSWELGHRTAMTRFGFESLEAAVAEFAEWNLFACHRDDGFHYKPDGLPCEFETTVPVRLISSLPGNAQTVEVGRLGAAYVEVVPDCQNQELTITVQGSGEPFAVRVVGERAAGGAVNTTQYSPGTDATVNLPGWNDLSRTVVALVNLADTPQPFAVAASGSGAYQAQPDPASSFAFTITPPNAALEAGSQVTLQATGRFVSCADDADVAALLTWSSSNEAVATVQAGVVTAVGAGTAQVTAGHGTVVSNPVSVEVAAKPEPTGPFGCSQAPPQLGGLLGLLALALRRRHPGLQAHLPP